MRKCILHFATCLLIFTSFIYKAQAQNSSPYWSLAGNSNATSASKLGTTNSTPLRLLTNNAERLRIDPTGKVGIGLSSPPGKLSVLNVGSTPSGSWITSSTPVFAGFGEGSAGSSDFILANASGTPSIRPVFIARKARGTLSSPGALATNDYIFSFLGSGYDGSTFQNPASIDFYVDGAVSAGNVPARISFVTGSNIDTRAERLIIKANGDVGVGTTSPERTLHVYDGSAGSVTSNPQAPLVVENNTNTYLNLLAPSANETGVLFGNPDGGAQDGGIIYESTNDNMRFRTNGNVNRMTLTGTGNLGIGTDAPFYPLHVTNSTESISIYGVNTYDGTSDHIGVYGSSVNAPGYGYGIEGVGGYRGIYGFGDGTSYTGTVAGVQGVATGTTGTRYGVYGSASGGTTNAAGYFSGAVYAASYNTTSDRKFKKDIKPLDNTLQQLMKLKPSSYTFKTTEFKNMGLPAVNQLGLIADEVKQVFPELVSQAVQPAQLDPKTRAEISPEIKYESVNYQGLIPVLVASIQEQQNLLEKQQAQIDELKTELTRIKGGSVNTVTGIGTLGLSSPNPAGQSARINYTLPTGSGRAQLLVTDNLGRTLKTVALNGSGYVNLDVRTLSNGVYNYSLVVDGKVLESKKLNVIR